MRQALANLDLGTVLALIRGSAGLSQTDLAVLVGWEQSAVARAETGTRDTLYDIRKLLAVTDALDMPREALVPLLLGASPKAIDMEDQLNRREFGGSLIGLALVGDTSEGASHGLIPKKVSAAHVRYLSATSDRLFVQDQKLGGAALSLSALRQYRRARRMLNEADYTESVGKSLISVAADLAICVGWLLYDAGNHTLSRQLYSDALLLANEIDDDMLRVRAMEKMSLQSVRLARMKGHIAPAREAARFSERASDLSRRVPWPRLHALVAARAALAHATLGDSAEFSRAIGRAWREVDSAGSVQEPVWLQFVTSYEITFQDARGRSHLGDHASAIRIYRESLGGLDASPRNHAIYKAALASELAKSGDASAAIEEGVSVLEILENGVSSPRTIDTLHAVRVVAHENNDHEFCTRFDVMSTKSLAT